MAGMGEMGDRAAREKGICCKLKSMLTCKLTEATFYSVQRCQNAVKTGEARRWRPKRDEDVCSGTRACEA